MRRGGAGSRGGISTLGKMPKMGRIKIASMDAPAFKPPTMGERIASGSQSMARDIVDSHPHVLKLRSAIERKLRSSVGRAIGSARSGFKLGGSR